MYERVYRYDKPVKEVFVDILNYTNQTRFKLSQLDIGTPVAIDHTRTQVVVKPAKGQNWTGSATLTYDRQDLKVAFAKVPLVIWCPEQDPQSLLKALHDQFHVLFTLDEVEFAPLEVPLDRAVRTAAIGDFEPPFAEPDRVLPDISEIWQGNFVLKAKPDNLVWVGETPLIVRQLVKFMDVNIQTTLAMNEYFKETLDSKVPVEIVIDRAVDASAFYKEIKKFKVGEVENSGALVNIARTLTHDHWIAEKKYAPFNLYNAKVLYNGHNAGQYFTGYSNFSHVLVIELPERYCSNLSGLWLIHYSDKDAYQYTSHRVDRGPMLVI